ncbi:hypothetical protein GCM10010844_32470 [Deinococcus radiotolerans]|uniref:Uncharacterized protein n=1 Tax=Deinococcus radiotolerans TaxID=1309407 RepID=A0ABQ2FNH1_9DEIO|nr:hypothetical protein GCM10010844_32470 [Deinococcus radiotolerans]
MQAQRAGLILTDLPEPLKEPRGVGVRQWRGRADRVDLQHPLELGFLRAELLTDLLRRAPVPVEVQCGRLTEAQRLQLIQQRELLLTPLFELTLKLFFLPPRRGLCHLRPG